MWYLPVDELCPLDDDEALAVMCRACRRTSPVTPVMLARLLRADANRPHPLYQAFEQLGYRLRCSACGARGVALLKTVAISAPAARLAETSVPDTFLGDAELPSWEDAAFGLSDEEEDEDEDEEDADEADCDDQDDEEESR